MFPGVKDPILKTELERFADAQRDRQPMASFEIVRVNFTVANQDVDIPHSLRPKDPEAVHYLVIGASAAGVVYQNITGTRKAWQQTQIYLRSSAVMTAILLLFTTDPASRITFFSV